MNIPNAYVTYGQASIIYSIPYYAFLKAAKRQLPVGRLKDGNR
jgi:hypothetical protein